MIESGTPRSRWRGRLRTAALAVVMLAVSAIVALLLAEGLVRLIAPQQLVLIRPDLWQPADSLGWVHRPNVATQINTGERTVWIYTDRDGLRVRQDGRHDAETRVLLLGDSFMEALQIPGEGTFASLLERELAQQLGRPVVVRNSGVGGWDPNQYLIRGRQMLATEKYALVVVSVFVGNDAVPQRIPYFPPRAPVERSHFRFPHSASRGELVSALALPLNDALEVRSHLFTLLKKQLSTLRMRLGLTVEYLPVEYRKSEAGAERWRVTADIAADIASAAQQHGARTIFMLVPERFQVYDDVFREYVRGFGIDESTVDVSQPSRRLYAAFGARGLDVIDVLDPFRAMATSGPRLFGTVDAHLSPAGHRALAQVVLPRAVQLLTAKAPTKATR